MTLQDTFNLVVAHSRTQKEQALTNSDTCVYLNDAGLKCFVGCLIPSDRYEPRFEGTGSIKQENSPIRPLMVELGHNLGLLGVLQHVHDHCEIEDWPKRLAEISEHYNLTMPEEL